MPHKVSFKAVTSGKDPLAKVSKRKSKAVSGESPEVPSSAPAPKRPRKASKKVISEGTPVSCEVLSEALPPSLPSTASPPTIPSTTLDINDPLSSLGVMVSGHPSPPPVSASGIVASSSSGLLRQRDEAWAQANHFKAQAFDFMNKHEDIQFVYAGLVKSMSYLSSKHETELAVFKSSLEELQSQKRDTRKLLAGLLEELRMRPPPEVVVENFKES
ncbi:hypothetical protein LIER_08077 [Lithospermum erythrorhizon]|uniref:Uncharacterized protein n=1 Tax=Lithospermum erythrorhizon TaxID=34254 RepID=A0AAV3PAN6_LITER